MNPPIPLPYLVHSCLIEKHLDEATCVALAISGAFDGFSSAFTRSRSWKGLVINKQSFYFTPSSWSRFIDQHIVLDSIKVEIKVFNANHFYWLPGHLLCSTIMKMKYLEELSIKGTQVCTVHQVAKILQSCPKITKLEFTYTEKSQQEIENGLKKDNISFNSLTAAFQKLTSLKLSTTVLDPKHDVYIRDPWLLMIKILSWCRDCTDLSIEMTYTGKPWSPFDDEPRLDEFRLERQEREAVERDLFPQLAWMKSLRSLVLVKLGPYSTRGDESVTSSLLNSLCAYLFPLVENKPSPLISPLQCIWIQNFEVLHNIVTTNYANRDGLLSLKTGYPFGDQINHNNFPNLENLVGALAEHQYEPFLSSTSKLKYYCGESNQYEELSKFCEIHPVLEHLGVLFITPANAERNPVLFKLLKLKFLSYRCYEIGEGLVAAMTEAYPNLENLQLSVDRYEAIPYDDEACLSAINFSKLTSLSLRGFNLQDGTFLLSIIEKCPNLKILHLETDSMESSSFLTNFKQFLQQAENLREFRLKWKHEDDNYPSTALSILKAILEKSVLLERVALIDGGSDNLPIWIHPPDFADFLVKFAAKMSHLTCCCLSFKQLDCFPIVNVKHRIAQEVVRMRPSLWFHMDRSLPQASDPGVPWVHYHQLADPMSCDLPRF